MNQDVSPLSRFLVLYQLVNEESDPTFTLHIQLYPGCADNAFFKLLHENLYGRIKEYLFLRDKSLLSLSVSEGDIVFIRTTQNDFATAGGIWQVGWQTRSSDGYGGSYVLEEIASSGIEMVEVKELLQEEEYTLFDDAVAHAKAFLEEQGSVSHIGLVDGREVGISAPERIHQVTPLPSDIRAVEHTWLLVLSGFKAYTSMTLFFLLEVVYRFQGQKWQFSMKILREGDDYETWSV